jgi:hypothetical protein
VLGKEQSAKTTHCGEAREGSGLETIVAMGIA